MANEEVQALLDFIGPEEELDDELKACLVTYSDSMVAIKHPLVINLFHTPMFNGMANRQLAEKRRRLEQAELNGEWYTYIFLHERPWRLEALLEVMDNVDDEQWWALVARVWMDSENIRECQVEWDAVLRSDRPGREFMMDDEDREALIKMPGVLTIYQGCTEDRDDGWSWTLKRETAEWFANRFASLEKSSPKLRIGKVFKPHVTAYLTDRSEHEIIVDPKHVMVTKVMVPRGDKFVKAKPPRDRGEEE